MLRKYSNSTSKNKWPVSILCPWISKKTLLKFFDQQQCSGSHVLCDAMIQSALTLFKSRLSAKPYVDELVHLSQLPR